jgi:hypothetical protein
MVPTLRLGKIGVPLGKSEGVVKRHFFSVVGQFPVSALYIHVTSNPLPPQLPQTPSTGGIPRCLLFH